MNFIPDALEKARAWVDQNKPEKAGCLLVEIIGNPGLATGQQRAGAYELLARCQIKTLDNSAARQSLDAAIAECGREGLNELQDACLLLLAGLNLAERSHRKAREAAQDCLSRAREQGWQLNEARALEILGRASQREQDFAGAIIDLDQAARIYETLSRDEDLHELDLVRAKVMFELDRPVEARAMMVGLLDFYGRVYPPEGYVRRMLTTAYSTWINGENELFARFAELTIEDSQVRGRPLMLACGYCNQGLAALNTGDHKAAKERFVKTWRIVSKVFENRLQVNTLVGLAICSIHLNNPHEALEFTMLARDNLKPGAGLTAKLLPYYSAIAHLASNLAPEARTEWNRKPGLELRGPLYYHRQWQEGLLRHIQSGFYWTKVPLGPVAVDLAGKWLNELESWR